MDEIGFSICHRLPERTVFLGDRAMPVCARDTGFFLGFALTVTALFLLLRFRPCSIPRGALFWATVVLVLPTIIDAGTSYAGLRETTNWLRMATGASAGTALAVLLYPLVTASVAGASLMDSNYEEADGGPTLDVVEVPASWRQYSLLLVIPILLPLLVMVPPGTYWFWAPAVTTGLLLTFLVLNAALISLGLSMAGVPVPVRLSYIILLSTAVTALELLASNLLHRLFS